MADLATIDARKSLVTKYANLHVIDPALVSAVIEQESSWNTWAVRYEPLFYSRYIQPLVNNGTVKDMTEATNRAQSFGLMQIMGQVAREFGFDGRFLTELCNPSVGLEFGCRKLKKCLDNHGGNISPALQSWNGGGAPNYAIEVQQRMKNYFA